MKPHVITEYSVVTRSKDILFSNLDAELLAIDSHSGYVYSLNETAGRIWDMLSEPCMVIDICSRVCAEFSVEQTVCLNEILLLLQGLCKAGLVQVQDA